MVGLELSPSKRRSARDHDVPVKPKAIRRRRTDSQMREEAGAILAATPWGTIPGLLGPANVIESSMFEAPQSDMFGHDEMAEVVMAGVDEAGRGPLAGAVYAAAVVLDIRSPIAGLADSKILKATDRERLALEIQSRALAWCVASANVQEIDSLNILRATFLAMQRAVQGLHVRPMLALVDGNQAPMLSCAVQTVIKGDALIPAISAASILAKTARDADLLRLHALYPQYGFDQHKGYGTALHLARLREHGPCPEHRHSFSPIRSFTSAA